MKRVIACFFVLSALTVQGMEQKKVEDQRKQLSESPPHKRVRVQNAPPEPNEAHVDNKARRIQLGALKNRTKSVVVKNQVAHKDS